jgi:lipopolysaccharide transport system permease protein
MMYIDIEPSTGWRGLQLGELWRYRELVYFLAWRDVKVRYKQTAVGVAWTALQPLAAMAVFAVFLGRFVQVPSDGVPYALFAYVGLLPWTYFANATTGASSSLVGNANLVTKVYFPRLAIPLAGVLAGLVDLAVGFILLAALLIVFGYTPGPGLFALPLLVALAMGAALGVGVWLSALDVKYRDVRYAVPFLIQVWLFATPVVYPSSVLPPSLRLFYALNPMVGVVEGFRWVLLGHATPSLGMTAVSTAVVLMVLVTGLFYFRRVEQSFADVI